MAVGALGEPAVADEVLILQTSVVSGFLEDHAGPAVSTPGGGFEEVVVLAPAFALAAAIECLLDAVEEALGYQRLMVAGILHTAVGQDPAIVLVRQHGVDVALADRLGGVEASWGSGKPSGGQLVGEIGDGDVALGVAFEGPLDKRGSLGVDLDRAGLTNPGRLAVLKGSAALESTSYMLRDDWRTNKSPSNQIAVGRTFAFTR